MKKQTIKNFVTRHTGRMRRAATATVCMLLAAVLAFTNMAPVLAEAAGSPEQQLRNEAQAIEQFVDKTADSELKDKSHIKKELQQTTGGNHFWGWLRGHKKFLSCWAVHKLTKLLEHVQKQQEKHPNAKLEELYTRLWTLRNNLLLNMPAGERCEGFNAVGAEPKTSIKRSDNKQLNFDVTFGLPTLTTAVGNNQTFTRVHVPGIETMVGKPGEPAIPMWRQLIALPQGAKPVVKAAKVAQSAALKINLVPFQEQAIDQAQNPQPGEDDRLPEPPMATFADKPFKINEQTYKTDRLFPPNPCKITPMGQYRDVQMAQLECATAQYNPVTDRYVMNQSIAVELAFEGGAEHFATSHTYSPFESHARLTDAALNKEVVSRYVKDINISILPCRGEELLVLTHQNFRAAADRLATHKRNKGISTSVFNVGSGVSARDTAEEIDDFIEDRYDDCQVRPSYVMLLGDAEYIPTFYPTGMPDNAGTDFPYSNYVQILFDAFFPDFGTGRVPVDTLAQANTVVDKIVKYESDPPFVNLGNGAPFYTTAGLAAQFQGFRMNANGTPLNNQPGTDQRAFIETTEFVRDELVDRGYTAPRIYTRTIDNGGYCLQMNASGTCTLTQSPYNGDTTPRRYFNGTLLPAAIGGGSGFAWNGNTTDITNAWNAGRFLFLHRDHGWPGGWGDPGFDSNNVDNLSNGERLPVVFSVNCASGMFDNETAGGTYGTTNSGVYWAERALRKADGGAIGVIGDTRNSPTWANNALTRGFFDAVWPNTVPTHGGNTTHKRLGDILNWGKIYLAGQVGVDQTAGSVSVDDMGYEYHIWHVIGDPTLEMWTKNPYKLVLTPYFKAELTRLGERIFYKHEGATITELQVGDDGEPRSIGRAVVQNGVAEMQYFQQPDPQAKRLYTASLPDSASVVLTDGARIQDQAIR